VIFITSQLYAAQTFPERTARLNMEDGSRVLVAEQRELPGRQLPNSRRRTGRLAPMPLIVDYIPKGITPEDEML
jgi:hypothetical protein